MPFPTGLAELDRVLGGGFVPGSTTVLGGEPGAGKSTLLLQACACAASSGHPALVVAAEEPLAQVRARAGRLGAVTDGLWLADARTVDDVVAHLDAAPAALAVVDSVQAIRDPSLSSVPGSPAQVRACAQRLAEEARARGVALVLVGHVTKEGALAGPRTLEHLVDSVLSFEGDRHDRLRLLRAVKHRFGPVGELGVFTLGAQGLRAVADPSSLFLADRRPGAPGSVVVPVLDGRRPVLAEVQALVVPTGGAPGRRATQGFDAARLGVLLAVAQRRAGLSLARREVVVSVAGGVRVADAALDLGVLVAVASAASEVAVPGGVVVAGEVGLGGELRRVPDADRRLAEAARAGFERAVVPRLTPDPPPGLGLVRADDLGDALDALGLAVAPAPSGRLRSLRRGAVGVAGRAGPAGLVHPAIAPGAGAVPEGAGSRGPVRDGAPADGALPDGVLSDRAGPDRVTPRGGAPGGAGSAPGSARGDEPRVGRARGARRPGGPLRPRQGPGWAPPARERPA